MKILQISLQFIPNIGGLETHLSDLVKILSKKGFEVFILCYQPLSTKTKWKIYERENSIGILRLPWLAGFFYKLSSFPKLEFLYLFPGLFIFTPFLIIFKKPNIIHAHGLIAGAIAVFWGILFKTKIIISPHNIYNFPKSGLYHNFAKFVFGSANYVLCLSRKSLEEIQSFGIQPNKIHQFTYWVDLKKFKKIKNAKKKLGWDKNFTVLFVGRLILEKGVNVLLKSVKNWNKKINLIFIGSGPLEEAILTASSKFTSVKYIGNVDQRDLPTFYSGADCVIVPSTHEEGFGRVIIESLACSTPVIASNRGAVSEAMDKTVGKLIDVNSENIKRAVEFFFKTPSVVKKLANNARNFAEKRYSESNADQIINAYLK